MFADSSSRIVEVSFRIDGDPVRSEGCDELVGPRAERGSVGSAGPRAEEELSRKRKPAAR